MKRKTLVIALALLVPVVLYAAGTGERGASAANTIEVIGEGTVYAQPDRAEVMLGVETFGGELADAVDRNQRAMTAVMAALADAGIPENHVQTVNYSVHFERDFQERQGPEVTGNYRVSNMVRVIVEERDALGEILDRAVQAGANQIGGVQFAVSDPGNLQARARELAMENARIKAEQLAGLAGAALGPAVRIDETAESPGGGPRLMAVEGMGGGAPIAGGELAVTVRLRVTYEQVSRAR